MRNLLFIFLTMLLLASCTKEESNINISITAEQDQILKSFIQEFDAMSNIESETTRAKLIEFYEVATIVSCDPGDFDIIGLDEINDYVRTMGHPSVRAFHDWTVTYGNTIRAIAKENEERNQDQLIDQMITDRFHDLMSTENSCELSMYTEFSKKALNLANTYGIYVSGIGYHVIPDGQLFLFDGAFNSFVKMQEIQEDCRVVSVK